MKDDRPYLEHIREALDGIAIYGSAGREAFFEERMLKTQSCAYGLANGRMNYGREFLKGNATVAYRMLVPMMAEGRRWRD